MIDDSRILKRKQIKSKTTDEDRWKWMLRNSRLLNFIVMLDNDDTYIIDGDDPDGDWYVNFDEFIGNADGVRNLLSIIGIPLIIATSAVSMIRSIQGLSALSLIAAKD